MLTRFTEILREALRTALMRILILTEKKRPAKTTARKETIFVQDIRVPPALVLVLSALLLFGVLLLRMGWSWPTFWALALFILAGSGLFVFYLKHELPVLIQDDEAMMLLGALMVFFVAIMGALRGVPYILFLNLIPAASILGTLLLHPRLSLAMTLVLSLIFAMIHQFSLNHFFLGFLGGVAGTTAAMYIRTHRDFIRVGFLVSLTEMGAMLVLHLLQQEKSFPIFKSLLLSFCNGPASSVLALGLLPFLESFFLRVTPMKLMELADFNQPLLKRLMVEAPGTYHHSLMMASVAEAAARAIGANPLLCRVGAYYHDIGKLVKPEYFIENQGKLGQNPHGNLAPALSSLVVISHIKEGVGLAKMAKLPQEIINFIPMHHGTSRVEYFYQQAKEDAEEELFRYNLDADPAEAAVREDNYRYPGPRPQSKETAILMLADSVEAASRTLDEPTHQHIKDLVEKLVRRKLEDGQLANAPLTLSDLAKIQDAFTNTLTSIYHSRIDYPEEKDEER